MKFEIKSLNLINVSIENSMIIEFCLFLFAVEIQLEEVKAEFGRQRLAQKAKKYALAALLCRLAVGSENNEQFDKQLKKTVTKPKKTSKSDDVPVISGEIKEPEGNKTKKKQKFY